MKEFKNTLKWKVLFNEMVDHSLPVFHIFYIVLMISYPTHDCIPYLLQGMIAFLTFYIA